MAFAKIATNFPNLTYEIYGTGQEHEKLQNLINSLNMSERIFLKGYTNSALELFANSLLSIATTKFEGYGMAILESLSMGCPVITSNVNYGPSEMVINGINGHLVNHDNVDEMAEVMITMLNNITTYQNNCLNTISDNHWDSWSNKLLDLTNTTSPQKRMPHLFV